MSDLSPHQQTGVQLGHQVSEEDIKRYREIFQLVSLTFGIIMYDYTMLIK